METIDIQKTFYKVGDFISWLESDQLDLNPEFQRRSVWRIGTKSYLVDTIIRGFPIPIIFIRERIDLKNFKPIREIIDGQQRLRTMIAYLRPELLSDFNPSSDDFVIQKAHNQELAGKKFTQLPVDVQRRILDYQFSVHILPSWIDDGTIIQIFRRMNSTNYTLNDQELRNAEFFGEFKNSVYELASQLLNNWRKWNLFTEREITRMKEVELTSDVINLILRQKLTDGSQPVIKKTYEEFEEEYPSRSEVEKRFHKVMETIDNYLGKDMPFLIFHQKTLFYVTFAWFYHLLYGIGSSLEPIEPKEITVAQIEALKFAAEQLLAGKSPQNVHDVYLGRRAIQLSYRRTLFEYFSTMTQIENVTAIN